MSDEGQAFKLKLKAIRDKKTKRDDSQKMRTNSQSFGALEHTLTPVLDTFVQSDEALQLQSSGKHGWFIAYGLRNIIRIWWERDADDEVELFVQFDSSEPTPIYKGIVDAASVQVATEHALLDWYEQLM